MFNETRDLICPGEAGKGKCHSRLRPVLIAARRTDRFDAKTP
jgi:hypothetical protein